MKKICMLFVILYTFGCVYGQNERKHYAGLHYSFGACNHYRSRFSSSKEYNGTNYYGIGVDYKYRYLESSELSLGIIATVNNMILTSTIKCCNGAGTNILYNGDSFFIFSFPVHFKYHFPKYFFIGGGPCLNIHPSMGYKRGVGIEVNAGAEYVFKSGLSVLISPRWQRNWLNFNGSGDSMGMDTLSQIGVNIGLGYKFGKCN